MLNGFVGRSRLKYLGDSQWFGIELNWILISLVGKC